MLLVHVCFACDLSRDGRYEIFLLEPSQQPRGFRFGVFRILYFQIRGTQTTLQKLTLTIIFKL